jgi:hypothetical protein
MRAAVGCLTVIITASCGFAARRRPPKIRWPRTLPPPGPHLARLDIISLSMSNRQLVTLCWDPDLILLSARLGTSGIALTHRLSGAKSNPPLPICLPVAVAGTPPINLWRLTALMAGACASCPFGAPDTGGAGSSFVSCPGFFLPPLLYG